MNMRIIKRIHLIRLLLLSKKKLLFIVLICVATCFFAMQIAISPMIAMLNEVSSTNMTDSYCLEFTDGDISETSKEHLRHMFDNSESIMGLQIDSGFYCSTYPDRPTLIGMKNGFGNKWYVQAEGRYFSSDEIFEGRSVAIIPWRDYEWSDFSLESHDFEVGLSSYCIVGLGEFSSASQFFIGKQQIYKRISQEDELQELYAVAFHDQYSTSEEIKRDLDAVSSTVLIPYTTYEKTAGNPDAVCFTFFELHNSQRENLTQELRMLFPEAIVTAPPKAEEILSESLYREIYTSIVLSICCLLYLIALFAYWIDQNQRNFLCCYLVGAALTQLKVAICISWICILAFAYVASFVLSMLFGSAFPSLGLSMQFHAEYHMALFLFVLMISVLLIIPKVKNLAFKTVWRGDKK